MNLVSLVIIKYLRTLHSHSVYFVLEFNYSILVARGNELDNNFEATRN